MLERNMEESRRAYQQKESSFTEKVMLLLANPESSRVTLARKKDRREGTRWWCCEFGSLAQFWTGFRV